jgi:hypothetical protein
MNETVHFDISNVEMDDRVRYVAGSRIHSLGDKIGHVKSIRRDEYGQPVSLGVDFGVGALTWASVNSWRLLPPLTAESFDIDKVFSDALGGPLAAAKAELERIEQRAEELRNAIRVIESVTNS